MSRNIVGTYVGERSEGGVEREQGCAFGNRG